MDSRWTLRAVPEDLTARYRAEGWWADDTLGHLVERGLGAMGDVPFRVRSAVRPWSGTVAEIDGAARSLASSLAQRGVGPGDVVVFQLPNWVEALITFWAAAYLGAVVVPIVHFYGPKEVDYILGATEPSVVVTAERFGTNDYLANYEQLFASRVVPTWLVVGDSSASELPRDAIPFASLLDAAPLSQPVETDPDSPAVIGFTSGTTRDPKGVIHSHRTIACETSHIEWMMPRGGPPQITGAPVGHFIGMLNAFLVPLLRPQPVSLIDVWDPAEVIRMMREERLTMSGGATYFLTSLLDHPDFGPDVLELLPAVGLGGAPVPVAVTTRATTLGITVFRSYGSTEHPSITGSSTDAPEAKRLTTDGNPMAGVEIRLDESGEIESRGPDLCLGYTDPSLTAAAFDAEGWYRTGDIGVVDDDGYLSITDRVSDVIIRGGENISAQEVEELLAGLEGVAEVSVVGEPDDRLGERAAAVLRLREGGGEPTLADVREHLAAAGLARQKWPESIHVVDEFPRTASGKVQKFRLRERLRAGSLDRTSFS